MKNNKNSKGFTLIELVVVISIIGVIAAILVPSLMYYIKKARDKAAIAETKIVVTAVQTGLADAVSDGKHSLLINKPFESRKVGRITNWMLGRVQNGTKISADDQNYVDYVISCDILEALSSKDKSFDFYKFSGNDRNMINMTAKAFQNQYHCTGLLLAYEENGGVSLVEFCHDNTFVRYKNGDYDVYDINDSRAKFSNVKDP